ncbi:MAG: sigma-70 family RNA polymerase sigma factor [Bacteroidetes bacterium]|nr:sigma-70 family RNA polymerase sigma factor [Bacteroidota bacterium]
MSTTEALPVKNFGLSQESFEQLVVQLKSGDESLFETIFLNHFEDCRNYLVKNNGLSRELAYDMTMDALLLFRKKLQEGKIKYGNLRFLLTRMAHQLYLKSIRKDGKIKEISADELLISYETEEVEPEVMSALGNAWKELCADCAQILKGFYYQKISLQDMAIEKEVTPASLRKRKQRCVEKLRHCFARYYHIEE